jgi:uncharacterized protein (TIGR03435 family)
MCPIIAYLRLPLALTAVLFTVAMPGLPQESTSPVKAAVKPPISFDVVSIKLNKVDSPNYTAPFPAAKDGLVIKGVNLYSIIRFAYDFWREDLISGVPAWAKAERYDIQAKVAGADVPAWRALNDDQRRLMLQQVLEENFKLKAHLEPKEVAVHELVVARGEPKMKLADPAHPGGLKDADGKPAQGILHTGAGQYTAQAESMADLALTLSDFTGRQVVDRTGLAGFYDFELQFTPEPGFGPEYRGQRQSNAPLPEFTGPSIFTAVQEQLGLKLEPAKVPVEGLVIDHLERPAEN